MNVINFLSNRKVKCKFCQRKVKNSETFIAEIKYLDGITKEKVCLNCVEILDSLKAGDMQ